jgi:hypothetical protein
MSGDEHESAIKIEGAALVDYFLQQWPNKKLRVHGFKSKHLDVAKSLQAVEPVWERLEANWSLSDFVSKTERALKASVIITTNKDVQVFQSATSSLPASSDWQTTNLSTIIPTVEDLLQKNFAGHRVTSMTRITKRQTKVIAENPCISVTIGKKTPFVETKDLKRLLHKFEKEKGIAKVYAQDLEKSLKALEDSPTQETYTTITLDNTLLSRNVSKQRVVLGYLFTEIKEALLADDARVLWLELGDLLPSLTPVTLLEEMRSIKLHKFGLGMKEQFVEYGLQLTKLQQHLRLEHAFLTENNVEMSREIENVRHDNWNPHEYCDWLLLEIHNDILIRQDQVEVARAIIAPASQSNSLLQMNMGKGKFGNIHFFTCCVFKHLPRLSPVIEHSTSANTTKARHHAIFLWQQQYWPIRINCAGLLCRNLYSIKLLKLYNPDLEV